MNNDGVTFEDLGELLRRLGCVETKEKTRTTFAHPALGTFLFFRAYEPKDIVADRDMIVVRRQVVDNGLLNSTAFDRFLHKATA
jgi:hypothetical protein